MAGGQESRGVGRGTKGSVMGDKESENCGELWLPPSTPRNVYLEGAKVGWRMGFPPQPSYSGSSSEVGLSYKNSQ